VVLCAIVAAVGAAMPALAQEAAPVTDTLKQAGETAGATIDKFADVVKGDPWRYGHFIAAGVALIVAFAADLARPGSLQRAGVRKLTEHASLTWFLCAVLVLGAQIVGSGFAGYLPASWRGLDASGAGAGSLQFQAVTQGASYVAALVTAFVLVRILHSSSKGAGLGFTARGFAWGMLGFLMAWPIVMSASIGFVALHEKMQGVKIASELGHPTLKLLTENQSSPYAWMLGLCAIVAAPLVEEIIYRGFVQSSVHRLTNSPWIAIFVSSVLFAGVHAIPNKDAAGDWVFLIPWYSAATVGVLGLCCGIAYERTKEIGVPIAMHILFNMSNVVLALVLTK
jgi:membrane protease YdiL (CAAX protease family)